MKITLAFPLYKTLNLQENTAIKSLRFEILQAKSKQPFIELYDCSYTSPKFLGFFKYLKIRFAAKQCQHN